MQNMCNSSCRAQELWSIVELFPLLASPAEFFALQTLFHCHVGCAASWCVIAIPACLSWMGLSFGLPFVPCCLLKWRLCGCCFCQDLLLLFSCFSASAMLPVSHSAGAFRTARQLQHPATLLEYMSEPCASHCSFRCKITKNYNTRIVTSVTETYTGVKKCIFVSDLFWVLVPG